MNEIKDGGPVFPGVWANNSDLNVIAPNGKVVPPFASITLPGMSLRDYFAAKAMQGICAHPDTWGLMVPQIAERAYMMADAMLRARGAA